MVCLEWFQVGYLEIVPQLGDYYDTLYPKDARKLRPSGL